MPFDINSAKPISNGKFNISTAKPIGISKPPQMGLISSLAGTSPEQLAQKGNWIKSGLLQTGEDIYREYISPLVSGASTFAFGIPRAVAGTTGTEEMIYPEQQTLIGKGLRLPAEVLGLIGGGAAKGGGLAIRGAQKIFPRLAGKTLLPKVARGIIGAGTFGLLQQPPEDKSRLQQAGEFAAVGGTLPIAGAGLKGTGQILTKSGRWVAKNIGGISDASVKIIKQLGVNRVFDPIKSQVDYIGSNIVPRVKERITNFVTNFTPKSKIVLKEVGFKPEEIEILNSIDKQTLNKLKESFGNDWNAIGRGLEEIKNNANLQFKTIFEKNPNARINPKNTFFKLGDLLKKEGWMFGDGKEIKGAGITNRTKTNLIKIYNDLRNTMILTGKRGGKQFTGYLNSQEYFNKLSELESSISGNPKFDRLVFEIQNSLRKDAVKAIPSLAQANKLYSDATNLLSLEPIFRKINDPVLLEKQLYQLKNVTKAQLHLKYKTILGNDIYNDVLAHLANQDFELVSNLPTPSGGFYPSRAGFIRKGVTGLAKKYYQTQPKIQGLKEALSKIYGKVTPNFLK